jgi:hypothetical protein
MELQATMRQWNCSVPCPVLTFTFCLWLSYGRWRKLAPARCAEDVSGRSCVNVGVRAGSVGSDQVGPRNYRISETPRSGGDVNCGRLGFLRCGNAARCRLPASCTGSRMEFRPSLQRSHRERGTTSHSRGERGLREEIGIERVVGARRADTSRGGSTRCRHRQVRCVWRSSRARKVAPNGTHWWRSPGVSGRLVPWGKVLSSSDCQGEEGVSRCNSVVGRCGGTSLHAQAATAVR